MNIGTNSLPLGFLSNSGKKVLEGSSNLDKWVSNLFCQLSCTYTTCMSKQIESCRRFVFEKVFTNALDFVTWSPRGTWPARMWVKSITDIFWESSIPIVSHSNREEAETHMYPDIYFTNLLHFFTWYPVGTCPPRMWGKSMTDIPWDSSIPIVSHSRKPRSGPPRPFRALYTRYWKTETTEKGFHSDRKIYLNLYTVEGC